MHFDILNHLGVDNECDRLTDRQTDITGVSDRACKLFNITVSMRHYV